MFTGLLLALMSYTQISLAEDTDIYSGLGTGAGVPNVMMIIDNASNSNAQMAACTYLDGTTPTGSNQGTKSLDNYMCALDNIAQGMSTKADGGALLNFGITTQAGVYLKLTPVSDEVYTGTYPHTAGQTNRQVISKAIRAMTDVTGSANQGASFQETWAYYTGGNGGTTNVGENSNVAYTGTNATTGCQKNFNIFISGVTTSAHSSTQSSLTNLTNAVNNAVNPMTGLSDTEKAALKTKYLTPVTAGVGSNKPYGIEWARFMSNFDFNTGATDKQNITTYAVAAGAPLYPGAMGDWETYIYDTAQYGGGKYFAAKSYTEIYQSILKILNEVQAVNSVFSASSLPVSVNAQGTYLNQIYMGMFRPDATGSPRWVGNMKQYQFVATRDANTNLINLALGDSQGNLAISSGGTGFISTNAVSYWTCHDSSVRACSPVADPTVGFWANNPQGVGGAFDLPDGELVEKGGAAQMMRLANLTADYTTTAGTSTNPRKLYTYCPSGSSCNANLTNSANAFSTDNVNITASAFGASSSLTISSIVRTGTSAVVTTSAPHNFTNGSTVIISGADQPEYNVTQAISNASGSTFTITGLPDYPTTPSTGAYTASVHNSITKPISNISVNPTSTTANANGCASGTIPNINCVQVTVTSASHGYANGDTVVIAGVSPSQYSGSFKISNVLTNTFTYNVPVTPTSPSINAYTLTLPASSAKNIDSISKSGNNYTVNANAHGFTNGQSVTITGNSASGYNGTWAVSSVATNSFQINASGNPGTGTGGTAALYNPAIAIAVGNISRSSATASTATATAASPVTNNQTYTLAWASGTNANEGAYSPLSGSRTIVATCASGTTCTTFTFPLSSTFSTTLSTSSPTVALSSNTVTIPSGSITRTGTTARVNFNNANTTLGTNLSAAFSNNNFIDIGVSGSAVGTENAYLSPAGGWQITCTGTSGACTTFTFGPVALTPTTPATTASTMRAYQGSTPPDRTSLIKWVRGEDNVGDEKSLCPPSIAVGTANCPATRVTVRPSLHGDVLHSRPVAINYGGTTGVVVYYGANDGVYRAVNGNQTAAIGTAPAGSELWGFVPTEFFGKFDRQRTNSPLLSLPSTPSGITPSPIKKDYFADGATSVYQLLNADGTTNKAYIYLSMRRGGEFIYALDVSNPTSPVLLWKLDKSGVTTPAGFTASTDFAELGQTWSAPKVALIKGYTDSSGNPKPVMIFGAGYSTTQDTEPATTDTMGRGIYIVDAVTGALVWRATYGATDSCVGVACTVSGMTYSIPADITLMDRDSDGYIDRLYAADVGGNIWRVDLQPSGNTTNNTPSYWRVHQLASLGGSTSPVRKFFFPPDVVPASGFDTVIAGTGDREHPLSISTTRDRIYVLKDLTGDDGSGLTTITNGSLFDATTTTYDASAAGSGGSPTPNKGYFKDQLAGEKVVNAPLTVAGYTYYGTNQPSASNSCTANLGIAKGYMLNSQTGKTYSKVYEGGGLPPSPVAGVVNVIVNGETTPTPVPFCIGCGGNPDCTGPDCKSAVGGGKPPINVPTSRSRTYWYLEVD